MNIYRLRLLFNNFEFNIWIGKFHILHDVINWCKPVSLTPGVIWSCHMYKYLMLQSTRFCILQLDFASYMCVCMQLFCSTAAATFRQAVALIFDRVVLAESLPAGKFGFGSQLSRTSSVTGDVNRSINLTEYAFPFMNTITDHYSFIVFCSLKGACILIFTFI